MTIIPLKDWQIGAEDDKDPASEEKILFDKARQEALNNSVLRFVAAFGGRLARAMNTSTSWIRTYDMVADLEPKRALIDAVTKGEKTPENVADELMDTVYAFSRHAEIRGKRALVIDALQSIQPIKV